MKTLTHILTVFLFLFNTLFVPAANAQVAFLPAAGNMVYLTPKFNPPVVKGMVLHPENPFKFDFILEAGDEKLSSAQISEQAERLTGYFLASLTTPENDMWVNLSPYEQSRIIADNFSRTEMGKELLAQDYLLKQIMATALYPEKELGQKFWQKVYDEANRKFGTKDVAINTFNKVWIVPSKAVVYENGQANSVFVVDAKLKVMLEQDYVAQNKNNKSAASPKGTSSTGVDALSSRIIKEVVIPALEVEVNEGRNFAPLRQVYQSAILAKWYKNNLKNNVIAQGYVNRAKTMGINPQDPNITEKIYQQYLNAYRKGVYSFIKEEPGINNDIVPRKYFSGGLNLNIDPTKADGAQVAQLRALMSSSAAKYVFATVFAAAVFQLPGLAGAATLNQDGLSAVIEEGKGDTGNKTAEMIIKAFAKDKAPGKMATFIANGVKNEQITLKDSAGEKKDWNSTIYKGWQVSISSKLLEKLTGSVAPQATQASASAAGGSPAPGPGPDVTQVSTIFTAVSSTLGQLSNNLSPDDKLSMARLQNEWQSLNEQFNQAQEQRKEIIIKEMGRKNRDLERLVDIAKTNAAKSKSFVAQRDQKGQLDNLDAQVRNLRNYNFSEIPVGAGRALQAWSAKVDVLENWIKFRSNSTALNQTDLRAELVSLQNEYQALKTEKERILIIDRANSNLRLRWNDIVTQLQQAYASGDYKTFMAVYNANFGASLRWEAHFYNDEYPRLQQALASITAKISQVNPQRKPYEMYMELNPPAGKLPSNLKSDIDLLKINQDGIKTALTTFTMSASYTSISSYAALEARQGNVEGGIAIVDDQLKDIQALTDTLLSKIDVKSESLTRAADSLKRAIQVTKDARANKPSNSATFNQYLNNFNVVTYNFDILRNAANEEFEAGLKKAAEEIQKPAPSAEKTAPRYQGPNLATDVPLALEGIGVGAASAYRYIKNGVIDIVNWVTEPGKTSLEDANKRLDAMNAEASKLNPASAQALLKDLESLQTSINKSEFNDDQRGQLTARVTATQTTLKKIAETKPVEPPAQQTAAAAPSAPPAALTGYAETLDAEINKVSRFSPMQNLPDANFMRAQLNTVGAFVAKTMQEQGGSLTEEQKADTNNAIVRIMGSYRVGTEINQLRVQAAAIRNDAGIQRASAVTNVGTVVPPTAATTLVAAPTTSTPTTSATSTSNFVGVLLAPFSFIGDLLKASPKDDTMPIVPPNPTVEVRELKSEVPSVQNVAIAPAALPAPAALSAPVPLNLRPIFTVAQETNVSFILELANANAFNYTNPTQSGSLEQQQRNYWLALARNYKGPDSLSPTNSELKELAYKLSQSVKKDNGRVFTVPKTVGGAKVFKLDSQSVKRTANAAMVNGGIDLENIAVDAQTSGQAVTTAFDSPVQLQILLNADGLKPAVDRVQPATVPMINYLLGAITDSKSAV